MISIDDACGYLFSVNLASWMPALSRKRLCVCCITDWSWKVSLSLFEPTQKTRIPLVRIRAIPRHGRPIMRNIRCTVLIFEACPFSYTFHNYTSKFLGGISKMAQDSFWEEFKRWLKIRELFRWAHLIFCWSKSPMNYYIFRLMFLHLAYTS